MADHFRDATKMVDWVIKAMGYGDDEANEAIRLSWCHLTPDVDWDAVAERVRNLL